MVQERRLRLPPKLAEPITAEGSVEIVEQVMSAAIAMGVKGEHLRMSSTIGGGENRNPLIADAERRAAKAGTLALSRRIRHTGDVLIDDAMQRAATTQGR